MAFYLSDDRQKMYVLMLLIVFQRDLSQFLYALVLMLLFFDLFVLLIFRILVLSAVSVILPAAAILPFSVLLFAVIYVLPHISYPPANC